MKTKYIPVFIAVLLMLVSCQQDELMQGESNLQDKESAILHFSLNVPAFTVATRAEKNADNIADLHLMTFDANHQFLKRIKADLDTKTATIPLQTKYIHFVGNYDWTTFQNPSEGNTDEAAIMYSLTTNTPVYWAYISLPSSENPINVNLLRNYAQVTVDPNGQCDVEGYALINYASNGTIVTNENTESPYSFANAEDKLTLPLNPAFDSSAEADCDNTPKYMFENENITERTYVILKVEGKFYKLAFLDKEQKPYKIERNYKYTIKISAFHDTPGVGNISFEDALAAPPANNFYAEIIKDTPIISDGDKNRLEIEKLNFIFTQEARLNVKANFYPAGSSTPQNSRLEVRTLSGEDILSGLHISDGVITAMVSAPTDVRREAIIQVYDPATKLAREINILSSRPYRFENVPSSLSYAQRKETVTLQFSLPETYSHIYPVKCVIRTNKLTPEDTNNMLVVQDANGDYKYIYEIKDENQARQLQQIKFQSMYEWGNEVITIENEHFEPTAIPLNGPSSYTFKPIGVYYYETYQNGNSHDQQGVAGSIEVYYEGVKVGQFSQKNVSYGYGFLAEGSFTINPLGLSDKVTLKYRTQWNEVCEQEFYLEELLSPDVKIIYLKK